MPKGKPLPGDRAVFDAKAYPERHANDTDFSPTSLHHTLGTGANQGAAGNHEHQKNNFTATVAPTVNDDSSQGYMAGSRWINIALGNTYECVDASVGAAVWNSTGGIGSGNATAIDSIPVDLTGITNGKTIVYNLTQNKLLPGAGGAALTVEEIDGTPTVANVIKIKVTNGKLTDNTGGVVTLDLGGGGSPVRMALFRHEDVLVVGSGVSRIYNLTGADLTISKVHAALNSAPAGSSAIFDVHKEGTTIFTTQANRPAVAAGANTGETTTIDVATWPNGSYLTADIDQIGSGTAGSDLSLTVVCS